jgi:hypothetical protein
MMNPAETGLAGDATITNAIDAHVGAEGSRTTTG